MAEPIAVLFIDTNHIFLNIVLRLLSDYYQHELTVIGSATSPDEAIRQARNLHPRVILLGIGQYSQDGRNLIAQLREAWPQAAIILLGAHDMEIYRQSALAAGASAYIAKNNLNRQLVPVIRRLTDGERSRAERMMPEPLQGDQAQV
jgi:DNA-binding NarL/FixJ family response regulator